MSKLFHKYNQKNWIVFLIGLIIGIVSFQFLPAQIPIHFNIEGVADNFASRWFIFLGPAVIFIINLLAELFRNLDPKSSSYDKFESHYYTIFFLVSLLMVGIQILTIAYVFGLVFNISRIMAGVMGVFFIYLGNIMPKFKHNYFAGIRTSWTIASERVWYLTHRFTGKIWVLGGFIFLFSVFLPVEWLTWIIIISIGVLTLVPLLASIYFYKQVEK